MVSWKFCARIHFTNQSNRESNNKTKRKNNKCLLILVENHRKHEAYRNQFILPLHQTYCIRVYRSQVNFCKYTLFKYKNHYRSNNTIIENNAQRILKKTYRGFNGPKLSCSYPVISKVLIFNEVLCYELLLNSLRTIYLPLNFYEVLIKTGVTTNYGIVVHTI